MHTRLIGYLLGALDREETVRVEKLLQTSGEARQQLEVMRLGMIPLEADREYVEPPIELVARTCQQIRQRHQPPQACV